MRTRLKTAELESQSRGWTNRIQTELETHSCQSRGCWRIAVLHMGALFAFWWWHHIRILNLPCCQITSWHMF